MKHVDGKLHFPLTPTTLKQAQFNINITFHTMFRLPTYTHMHTQKYINTKAPTQLPEATEFEWKLMPMYRVGSPKSHATVSHGDVFNPLPFRIEQNKIYFIYHCTIYNNI